MMKISLLFSILFTSLYADYQKTLMDNVTIFAGENYDHNGSPYKSSMRIVGCEHPYKCEPIQTIKELNSDNKTINVILLDNNTKYMAYVLD